MSALRISGAVRREVGERNCDALQAGVGLPADAQCWCCGAALNLFAAAPGSVSLSCLVFDHPSTGAVVTITLWAHAGCSPSRLVDLEEFRVSPAAKVPSPISEDPVQALIDGRLM